MTSIEMIKNDLENVDDVFALGFGVSSTNNGHQVDG